MGEARAQSDVYPAAYRISQTPLRRGDMVGSWVGFVASNFNNASLMAVLVSLDTSPNEGRESKTELTKESASVGVNRSLSTRMDES